MSVKITGDSFETSIFRKSTHTGVFLSFLANAPTAWKRGLIKCLLHRAKMICSSVSLFNNEVDNLRKMFVSNAYPVSFFNNVVTNFCTVFDCALIDNTDENLLLFLMFLILVNVLVPFLTIFLRLFLASFRLKFVLYILLLKLNRISFLNVFRLCICRPILFIVIIA